MAYIFINEERAWESVATPALPVNVIGNLFHVDFVPKLPDIAEEKLDVIRSHSSPSLSNGLHGW